MNKTSTVAQRTISDFGTQWQAYTFQDGYLASVAMLQDIFGDLITLPELQGSNVMEIGSGNGRIVNMLGDAGAGHITAVEPSDCFEVLKSNTERHRDKITYLNLPGDQLPKNLALDKAFSIGVIHHIPEPKPVIAAMYDALKPGGQIFIWLYGREGNRTYLFFVQPLRLITQKLPHKAVDIVSVILERILAAYIGLCKYLPLPMRAYMRDVLAKYNKKELVLTIYDQLNPAYAKYYSLKEGIKLLEDAGFTNIRHFHRHGYSWSLSGIKPV